MGKSSYELAIRDRLQGKPHLQPVFSSVYFIPERLREYDADLFVVRNSKKQRFEVHSLANIGDTYGLTVPYPELDARTITLVQKNNLAAHGRTIFREIDQHNERLARSLERARQNELRALAEEVKPAFAKVAWEGV